MIVQDHGDHLILIRQTDHSLLAGFFARAWGNDLFQKPQPFDSFCLAVGEHDNGWRETELEPELDPKSRNPYTFMSLPTEEHIALYQRGLERIVKVDHYAGLLVSMHCLGLYDRARATIPGFSAKYVKSEEAPLANEFQQRLRLQQLRLKVDLRANAATKAFTEERILNANAQRLESLDRLSLYFCLSPLQSTAIENVPMDDAGREADWELRPEAGNTVSLGPYPFKKNPLEFSILARRIPKRVYASEFDFRKTLAAAPYFALNFTLRAGGARVQSKAAIA